LPIQGNISGKDIASFVGIDRTYLYKIFLKNRNISPKEYINQIRMNAAKNMLTEQYTVEETALSCGFHDSAAFCNAFKKQTGFTPRQFSAGIKANHAVTPH
jgi:AraC-like DNA-binding protein